MRTESPEKLSVRLLALGEGGGVASIAAAVRRSWGPGRQVDLVAVDVGDDPPRARAALKRWCDRDRVDVVLTLGRQGHREVDYAPELVGGLLHRPLPGVEERMYLSAGAGPEVLLSRGRAGLRHATLLVNLPAQAARAGKIVRLLAPVIGHAIEKARGGEGECGRPGVAR